VPHIDAQADAAGDGFFASAKTRVHVQLGSTLLVDEYCAHTYDFVDAAKQGDDGFRRKGFAVLWTNNDTAFFFCSPDEKTQPIADVLLPGKVFKYVGQVVFVVESEDEDST